MLMLLLIAVISILSLFLFHHVFMRTRKKRFPPLAGSVFHQLYYFSTVHDYHTDLAAKYKTFRIMEPGRKYIFTVDPAVIEYMLKTNFTNYGKGSYNYVNLTDLLGDGIFVVDGEKWRHQRKLASYEFSTKNLRIFSGAVFKTNADKLAMIISDSANLRSSMDIQDLFMRTTMDSTFKIMFGVELDTLSGLNYEGTIFANAFNVASDLALWRFVDISWKIKRFLNIGTEATLKKNIRIIDDYVYKLIRTKQESISELQNQDKNDILSRFLMEREKDLTNMNDRYLRDIIINIIMAGRDSTAVALSWLFYMLCKYPYLQDKIAEEVKQATKAENYISFGDFTLTLTEKVLDKMQFLHATITETLRLYPSIPEDPKICFSDDKLPNGLDISKGDMLCYLPYSMGRMKFLWGEDAEIFRPERWLDENGVFQPESPFKFTAFQAGPRFCLGKDFAYRQIKIISAVLVHFFTFKLKDEAKDVKYETTLTLRIDKGLKLLAFRRSL